MAVNLRMYGYCELPPIARLGTHQDWKEFHMPFDDAKLQVQAARCMGCGVPFVTRVI